MSQLTRFVFSKKLRLLTSDHFDFVFKCPKLASVSQMIILGRLNLLEHPRIGIIIAKKNVKFAHERNRIKRLIRENFRLCQHKLPKMDFVVVIKRGITNFSNRDFLQLLEKLWSYYY